ncbi:hypothetical protein B0H15DRAFT_802320 [Mycena belliarum]|uniref:Uncharacterized protein n=1 Tax=Mycena belliarum TaxID=1033014 RepID=A0AAD6TZ92_9AGAR|nr:hypothetical protein B0H15DRAFT_802319 [Mycena belliae]KAJ7084551.1 hypothetical protein B0H15DRAFT_802320 [Mycena belliae]
MTHRSFNNLKPQWKCQQDADAEAKAKVYRRTNRRKQRRVTKLEQIKSAVHAYVEEQQRLHGRVLDPDVILESLNEEHESDEASGPEDGEGESQETWKTRMASIKGMAATSSSTLDTLEFVEFSNLLHEIHATWFNSLTPTERKAIKYIRVRGTDRVSSRVPEVSPWDFGISDEWLEAARRDPENQLFLSDWGTHGNPAGFNDSFFGIPSDATELASALASAENLEQVAWITGSMGVQSVDATDAANNT